jgi:RNA polymerase sigma-70 factor (ECF subfamily)
VGAEEAVLISRARRGDVAAFEELISAYERKVYNLAYRMCGEREDAADLAQEALVRAFRAIGRFREQSQFSTWLYRIVVNVCLDHQRSRKRHPTVSLDEPMPGEDGDLTRQIVADTPDPQAHYEQLETQMAVQRAISRLSADHRTVVVMRDIQDMAYEDIAAALGLALGTVKSRLNRARQALREELQRAELIGPQSVYAGSRDALARGGHA